MMLCHFGSSYLFSRGRSGGLGKGDAGLLLSLLAARSAELDLVDRLGSILACALKVHFALHPEECLKL